jgi:hypothetical protein
LWQSLLAQGEEDPELIIAPDERTYAASCVQNTWRSQGIWKNEWVWSWPTGVLPHQHGPEIPQNDKWIHEHHRISRTWLFSMIQYPSVPTTSTIHLPSASLPYHQFEYHQSQELKWVRDEREYQCQGNEGNEINLSMEVLKTEAYHSLKAFWINTQIWRPEWNGIPNSYWAHEELNSSSDLYALDMPDDTDLRPWTFQDGEDCLLAAPSERESGSLPFAFGEEENSTHQSSNEPGPTRNYSGDTTMDDSEDGIQRSESLGLKRFPTILSESSLPRPMENQPAQSDRACKKTTRQNDKTSEPPEEFDERLPEFTDTKSQLRRSQRLETINQSKNKRQRSETPEGNKIKEEEMEGDEMSLDEQDIHRPRKATRTAMALPGSWMRGDTVLTRRGRVSKPPVRWSPA